MRLIIAIILGLAAGLGVRALQSPAVKEITAPAASYSEVHAQTLASAESKMINQERKPPEAENPAYPETLFVRGYMICGDKINVVMSDGTTVTEKTGGLERVERSHIVFRGKSYALKGAGVNVTPDRPGGVPPVAEVAESRNRGGFGGLSSPHPLASGLSSSQPDQKPQGSWEIGPDGVSRLREGATLGR